MIIGIGAEGILEKKGEELVKRRIVKGYRLKEIDGPLRKSRTEHEAKLIGDAKRWGVRVPDVYESDSKTMEIRMEFIDGPMVKTVLDGMNSAEQEKVCHEIGVMLGKLHSGGIVHGDLTTSNMILRDGKIEKLYFIDFGLAFYSKKIEDLAVDLHLIKEALLSKHNNIWEKCFNTVVDSYSKTVSKELFGKVIERLKKVEKRGRYTS